MLLLNNIGGPDTLSIPSLKNCGKLDTLILRGIKLKNLDFIDDKLPLKVIGYDIWVEFSSGKKEFEEKAKSIKANFHNETIRGNLVE